MADVHTREQRSRNMSAIKGSNTKPEIKLRKLLWAKGLRYRLKTKLPGKPDMVFPAARLAVFVDGCFWHRCPDHFKMPTTRPEFWKEKISGNIQRDKKVNEQLKKEGWTVLRFWEHEIRQDAEKTAEAVEEKHRRLCG